MLILEQSYGYLQSHILPAVSKRHQKLFTFGFEALTLRPFVSLNSNARITITNRKTAERKIQRVVANRKILSYFPILMHSLGIVSQTDTINVDFSTFCGYNTLTFAKQTRLGRAIPLYIAVIEYPVDEGSQGKKESWYLLTNIQKEVKTKEEIVAAYYFRFEIEEMFKDIKHIFDLKTFYKIKTQQTFLILLWFVILGIWLTFLLSEMKQYLKRRLVGKRRKKLSLVKYFSEQIQLELFLFWRQHVF